MRIQKRNTGTPSGKCNEISGNKFASILILTEFFDGIFSTQVDDHPT